MTSKYCPTCNRLVEPDSDWVAYMDDDLNAVVVKHQECFMGTKSSEAFLVNSEATAVVVDEIVNREEVSRKEN